MSTEDTQWAKSAADSAVMVASILQRDDEWLERALAFINHASGASRELLREVLVAVALRDSYQAILWDQDILWHECQVIVDADILSNLDREGNEG